MTAPLVTVENISRYFGRSCALRNISFTVSPGEIVALCGPNGAGKSTLLHCVSGLLSAEGGSISLQRSDKCPVRVGFAGGQSMLYPDLTVGENLELFASLSDRFDRAQLDAAIALFELAPSLEKRVRHCSQGTVARASIARALLTQPQLLLLDEPFAHLDPGARRILVQHLCNLQQQGVSTIVSVHDEQLLDSLGARVLRLEGGRLV